MPPTYDVDEVIETHDNRYRVLRLLGIGGMCAVYLVRDEKIGRKFVLKMLLPKRARKREERERFFREGSVLGQLQCEHIVSCTLRAESKKGEHFLLLEHIEGQSIRDLLDRDGALHLSIALKVAIDVLDGLHHAHSKGIVHRDIKPENVLYLFDRGRAVVIDFGIMRPLDPLARITGAGASPCTAAYAAPEQLGLDPIVSCATDIHAVGVLIFEMLTGQNPFAEGMRSVKEILEAIQLKIPRRITERQVVPPELDAIVARALSKNPSDRPEAAMFLDVLTRIVEARDLQVRRRRETGPVPVLGTTDRTVMDTRTTEVPINAETLPARLPDSLPGDLPLVSSRAPMDADTIPLGLGTLRKMRTAHPDAMKAWTPITTVISDSISGVWRTVRTTLVGSRSNFLFVGAAAGGLAIAAVAVHWSNQEAPRIVTAAAAAAPSTVSPVSASVVTSASPRPVAPVAPAASIETRPTPDSIQTAVSAAAPAASSSLADAGALVVAKPRRKKPPQDATKVAKPGDQLEMDLGEKSGDPADLSSNFTVTK